MPPRWLYWPAAGGSFAPDDLSDLVVWLDADDTAFSNNDAVAAWNNKGTAADTSQSDSAKRPVFKTGLLNGKPGVDFDGTNDCLQIASLDLNTYISVFWVAQTTTSKPFFCEQSVTANTNDGFFVYGAGTPHYNVRRTTRNAYNGTSSWFGSAAAQAAVIIDAIASAPNPMGAVYKDGTLQADGAANGGVHSTSLADSSVTDTLYVGARNDGASLAMDGNLHELLIYNAPLSSGNREKVEGYLAHKWGLTSNLPSTHPYKSSAP
jgi:hypothetical protein